MAKWHKHEPSLIELAASRLADLESLVVAIERFIESEIAGMDRQVAIEADRAYEEMQDEWPDYWPDDEAIRDFLGLTDRYWKFEEEFPNTLRKSLFVTIYSLIENVLLAICRQKEREGNLSPSVEDFFDKKPNLLRQSKIYLKEVAGLSDFPANSNEWSEIFGHYRRLRNCIVHNEGRLKGLRSKKDAPILEQYIQRKSSLEWVAHKWVGMGEVSPDYDRIIDPILGSFPLSPNRDRIIFQKGFCEEVLETTRSFFDLLSKTLS